MSIDLNAQSIMQRIMDGVSCDDDGVCYDSYAMAAVQELCAEIERLTARERELMEAVKVLADECNKAQCLLRGDVVSLAISTRATEYRDWTAAQNRTDRNPIAAKAIKEAKP